MNLNNLTGIQLDNQKRILIVIFCVLVAYMDVNFILKNQSKGLKELGPKISKLEKDLANLKRDLENMKAYKTKAVSANTVIKPNKILFESQVSGMLNEISGLANKFNIQILQIRPSRESKAAKPASTEKFIPYLISLDLVGDYHNLGGLLNALENSAVFMEVQELKISTQLPDYMKQKINLVIKTYVYQ